MPEFAIVTRGLTKRYGDVVAVESMTLRVARCEIYGFLGLNGAGKSTTIRMLLGMIAPSAGQVELFGHPVKGDAPPLWRRVGHLVEGATAYPELTVRENLHVAAHLQGIGSHPAVPRAIEQLGLGPYADRRAGALSHGNLQRLALARALLHEPELLVLDEPANGLDPVGVIEIRELLRRLANEQGVTVFMSSHILAEVDLLATRIGIIHRGRLVEEFDAEALALRRDQRLEVGARHLDLAERCLREAGYVPRARHSPRGGPILELREPCALEAPEQVVELLVRAGARPTRVAVERESLEEHFVRLTSAPHPPEK